MKRRMRYLALGALLLPMLFAGAPAQADVKAARADSARADSARAEASPGDLVSAQEINAPGFFYARVWKILYASTDTHGAPITVSGTVIVPKAPYGAPRPIVGYAPGTHGMGDQCAPSRHLEAGDENEGGLIHQYAGSGLAVAVTDYEGLGTPGDHRYMVARSAAHVLLDIVRAAQRLPGAGLPADGPVGLAGYSQGGHAASWAAQVAPDYAPDLDVKAVASGGTPVDLRHIAAENEGGENFGLVLAAGIGMDAGYPELDLESFLNDAGRAGIEELRNGCDFSPYAGKTLADYTTSDPLETEEWRTILDAQNVGGMEPRVPVLLYHSTGDEIIPYEDARELRAAWCDAGVNVTFRTFLLLEHATTAAVASPYVTTWMRNRLDGRSTPGNC
ncbi:MAG: lipase [Streptosporangiales bacterium]|nr:lipase [Streptosporangiales bacterium]